jgi:hypothetical protein
MRSQGGLAQARGAGARRAHRVGPALEALMVRAHRLPTPPNYNRGQWAL